LFKALQRGPVASGRIAVRKKVPKKVKIDIPRPIAEKKERVPPALNMK
jgi:hypothetical protein